MCVCVCVSFENHYDLCYTHRGENVVCVKRSFMRFVLTDSGCVKEAVRSETTGSGGISTKRLNVFVFLTGITGPASWYRSARTTTTTTTSPAYWASTVICWSKNTSVRPREREREREKQCGAPDFHQWSADFFFIFRRRVHRDRRRFSERNRRTDDRAVPYARSVEQHRKAHQSTEDVKLSTELRVCLFSFSWSIL